MKKIIGVIFLCLLFFSIFSFVYAQETPGEGIIEVIPITEEGEIDKEEFIGAKSKAEERIDKINEWLDNNVSWLDAIFGMRPEVSWLFAINIFLWLFFFNLLVVNANTIFIFLSNKNIRLVLGFAIFIPFLVLKVYLNMARFIHNFFWTGKWYGGLLKIALIIAFIIMGNYVIKILKKTREQSEKSKEETNREALGKIVKGATDS